MSKTPTGTNGTAPDASADDRRSGARESRRSRRPNNVQPSPGPAREHTDTDAERKSPASRRPPRDRSVRREGHGDDLRAGRNDQEASANSKPNSIRPTQHRVRSSLSAAGGPAPPGSPLKPADPTNRRPDLPEQAPLNLPIQAPDPYTVPDDIQRRFVKVGRRYHFADGARAFTDHGNRLTSPSENTEVIKSLIAIAHARGWSDITISGSKRFREAAWFAARLQGIDVRGHVPTEQEEARLVRTLARSQGIGRDASAEPRGRRADERAAEERANGEPRMTPRSLQVGKLIDHGAAPYKHDSRNPLSYFVHIETRTGELEIWGVDLQRALKDSLTRVQIGDEVGVRKVRRDDVKVYQPLFDERGRVIGQKPVETHRNAWMVEKHSFFRDRADAARVVRDEKVDGKEAVKQRPELAGTYAHLRAAELTAKSMHDPAEQRRFVSSVRTALADSIARGEPLPSAPMKDRAAQRVGARERGGVPPPAAREAAPAR